MQRKSLAASGGLVGLGIALLSDPLGHIEMVVSNWPLVWAFVPAIGSGLAAGGAIWFILSVGAWTRGALRKRYDREQVECAEVLDDLAQTLAPRDRGWPVVEYLRQQELVDESKRRKLLPPHVKAADGGLRDICKQISEMILRYGVKRARRFVRERLSK